MGDRDWSGEREADCTCGGARIAPRRAADRAADAHRLARRHGAVAGGLGRPKIGLFASHARYHHAQGLRPSRRRVSCPASYEAALEELEQLVGRLESGDLPLEQLLGGYQRGAELLQFCRDKLEAVENQIKVLDDGALKTVDAEA